MNHTGNLTAEEAQIVKEHLKEETPATNVTMMVSGIDQWSVTFDFTLSGFACKGQVVDSSDDDVELGDPSE